MSKIIPRGSTPSLIGGTNGKPLRAMAGKKCDCYRCHDVLIKGQLCIDIPKLGGPFAGTKRVCNDCFKQILDKTALDLQALRQI